jgi:predicted DNA-binding transcriptional regulator AlpA
MSPSPDNSLVAVQVMRLPEVCKVTGLGRSMIYQLESQREFPARVRLSARAVGWVDIEVRQWLAQRMHNRRSPGKVGHDV